MDVSMNFEKKVQSNLSNSGIGEATKQDSVESLKARIAELELALQKQIRASEKGDKLLKVMWGDDFNDDSLH